MIRIVNLIIGLSSTVICIGEDKLRMNPDAPCPVYILEKNQNINRMEDIRFSNFFLKKNKRSFWSFLQGQF